MVVGSHTLFVNESTFGASDERRLPNPRVIMVLTVSPKPLSHCSINSGSASLADLDSRARGLEGLVGERQVESAFCRRNTP